jgi:hypothetical protein
MLNRDGSYVGYIPDLLDKLNITYNISLAPDSQYGVQYPNGSWAGMVGELANGVRSFKFEPLSIGMQVNLQNYGPSLFWMS